MNREQLLKKMRSINQLPTLPTIVLEVNRLLQDFDSPMEQLVELLNKDQTLVMKILRLVNSSFYGFKSKVKSVRNAVTLLGYNTVRNAVITVSVIDTLSLLKDLPGFRIEDFWKHSLQVAVLSRYLSIKTRLATTEDAFTAGLLHDIGKVVLANYFADELTAILHTSEEHHLTFYEAEMKLGGCPHNLIGSYLAQQWMLPAELSQTIQYHHRTGTPSSQAPLIALIQVVDGLAHMMNGDAGYHLQLDQAPEAVRATITAALQSEGKWFAEVKQELEAAYSFFNKG